MSTNTGLQYFSRILPAIIPARLSCTSGRYTTSTLSLSSPPSSICLMASSTPFNVSSFLLSFIAFRSPASTAATSMSCALKSSSALAAVSSRPVAFRQGPRTKPIVYGFICAASVPVASISAFNPIFLVCFISSMPLFTIMRFSSLSSITSPIVAKAASSSSSSPSSDSIASRQSISSFFASSASTSLYATTAPQISGNG